ncbi:hypothetical protein [Clostridium sp.]|jgi:hypothetical protein
MTHYRFDKFYPYVKTDLVTSLEYRMIAFDYTSNTSAMIDFQFIYKG